MAELTGIEPVPADRQSASLPIDHSSGSLPCTRTTIFAFRAQHPAIGQRGNFRIVKELAAGERFERPYPDSVQGPATRRPGIKLSAVSLSCTARTIPQIHRGSARAAYDPCEPHRPTHDDRHPARSTAPMQARFQSPRLQSFVYS